MQKVKLNYQPAENRRNLSNLAEISTNTGAMLQIRLNMDGSITISSLSGPFVIQPENSNIISISPKGGRDWEVKY